MEREIWKDVVGFEGRYQVSSIGRVKSLKREVVNVGGFRIVPEKIKKQTVATGRGRSKGKYPHSIVMLYENNNQYRKLVHRLVLEAFIGKAPVGFQGCHNDGNGLNNRIDNLRWDTPIENVRDSIRHGTFKLGTIKNENHCKAKYKNYQVIMIRKLAEAGVPRHIIEKAFDAKKNSLSRIITGKTWRLD